MNREELIREIQEKYRHCGRVLNELQRRHWAATEAAKLGRGGITLVSKALRISPNTIKRGIQEIAGGQLGSSSQANERIRKPGGGRKSKAGSAGRLTRIRSTKEDSADPVPELVSPELSEVHGAAGLPIARDLEPTLGKDDAPKQPD
jgi:hypothetical protein